MLYGIHYDWDMSATMNAISGYQYGYTRQLLLPIKVGIYDQDIIYIGAVYNNYPTC